MHELLKVIYGVTEYSIIDWKPMVGEIKDRTGSIKEYKAKIENTSIRTIVAEKEKEGFWGKKTVYGYALEIKEGKEKIVLTSDPEIIPGEKEEDAEKIVHAISWGVESQHPINSLAWKLSRNLTRKLRKLLI